MSCNDCDVVYIGETGRLLEEYKMSCNDCGVVYIGETGRLLEDRTEEHRKDVVKSKVITFNTFMFNQWDVPSIYLTSVLLENHITSEYDENWRESTHLMQLILLIELGRCMHPLYHTVVLLCKACM